MGEIPGGDQCFFAKRTRTSTADGNHGSGYRTRNRDLGAVLPDAGKMAYAHLHAKDAMSVLDPEASLRVLDIEWEKVGLFCWQKKAVGPIWPGSYLFVPLILVRQQVWCQNSSALIE